MSNRVDPGLAEFAGSETRVLTLGVLANATRPLTGYRIAKIAGRPEIKVYEELRRATGVGTVEKTTDGFRLVDPDLRALLRKRIRLFWSEDWYADEFSRSARAETVKKLDDSWFDPSRYVADPKIARKFAKEFERPPEKGPSRKTGWK
jgi:hypothetical protein